MAIQIQKFMERLGIRNQAELAARLGLTQAAVSAWNAGVRKPAYEVCVQLLEMGMTVEELFGKAAAENSMTSGGRPALSPDEERILAMVKRALVSLGKG